MQGTLLECEEADRKKHKVCLHLRSSAPIAGKLAAQLRAAVSGFFVEYTDISIRSLKSGKHVYSAVPMASSVEECKEIVELVEKTDKK